MPVKNLKKNGCERYGGEVGHAVRKGEIDQRDHPKRGDI